MKHHDRLKKKVVQFNLIKKRKIAKVSLGLKFAQITSSVGLFSEGPVIDGEGGKELMACEKKIIHAEV